METIKRHVSRIITFDLMRGYFLVAIIIDHLNFFPNGLDWWSARGGLFVTAAEGFFLISGIILGIVRGSKLIDKPFKHVAALLIKRGVQLYLTAFVLILLFTALGWQFYLANPGLKPGILPPDTNVWEVIWRAASMQYYYGWADYLRLYAIFLFVSPLVFWLLRKGKWYIVALLSFLVWLLFPNDPALPPELQEYLQPLSWQLLFFTGTIIGFHWNRIASAWQSLRPRVRSITIVSLLCIAGSTFIFNVLIMLSTMGINLGSFITPQLQQNLYISFFDKERLPLTRFALALAWFWAGFYLFSRFERQIKAALGWLILPFGMNSLYVYTMHAVAIFFVHLYFQPSTLWQNFLVVAGVILTIRVLVHYKVLMNIVPR